MKEFLVGLLVIVMVLFLSGVGLLLFPLLLVMGIFLRVALGFLIILIAIWLVGKLTLLLIELLRNKENKKV